MYRKGKYFLCSNWIRLPPLLYHNLTTISRIAQSRLNVRAGGQNPYFEWTQYYFSKITRIPNAQNSTDGILIWSRSQCMNTLQYLGIFVSSRSEIESARRPISANGIHIALKQRGDREKWVIISRRSSPEAHACAGPVISHGAYMYRSCWGPGSSCAFYNNCGCFLVVLCGWWVGKRKIELFGSSGSSHVMMLRRLLGTLGSSSKVWPLIFKGRR